MRRRSCSSIEPPQNVTSSLYQCSRRLYACGLLQASQSRTRKGCGYIVALFFAASTASAASIHVDADAPAGVHTTAAELAAYFKQASGEEFTVTTNAFGSAGVYLGVADLDSPGKSSAKLPELGPEGIHIRATTNSLVIVGNTELAVSEGVYLYLQHLGFRWFFPHEAWHVAPRTKNLFVDFEMLTRPDYEYRRIWYAYGSKSEKADADYRLWCRANRQGGAFRSSTGHAYPGIINRNKVEFEAHPEYFAILADGQRDTNRVFQARKFCVSNEGLVQLCIADALRQFAADPSLQMVSLDPSDGPGSCECDDCKNIGTITDRVFHLANRVAKAVGENYPGKWVGLYAYSSHQLPTNLKLEPNVYTQVATAFNSTPLTLDQLVAEWGKRVSKVGIREYYGVMAWDEDMPARPRGARLAYVRKSIPHFHKLGANAINAESNIGWISRGLGHYVAAQLMWDTKADVDALVNDFYEKCFGKARGPIEEMFNQWQRSTDALPTSHDMAIWLKLVEDADRLAGDDATRARIDQIKYYLHYVALFYDWHTATGDKAELKAFENLVRYTWRVKDLGVTASYALARRKANSKAPTPLHRFNHPDCVWRDETPVTREELAGLFKADRGRFKAVEGLRTVDLPREFQPLDAKGGQNFESTNTMRGPHEFFVQIPGGGATMRVALGFIYGRNDTHTLALYGLDQDIDDENNAPVFEQKVLGDQEFHEIDFRGVTPGLYRMRIDDRRSSFKIETHGGLLLSVRADSAGKVWTTGRSNFCFLVPKGTRKFALVAEGPLTLQKPGGEKIEFPSRQPLREVSVREGEEGVWLILQQSGRFHLVGVPPLVGFAPDRMLVAKETGNE